MGDDRPARVRLQQRGLVAVEQDEAVQGGSDRKATERSRLAISCPGTTSASGLWTQQTRWCPPISRAWRSHRATRWPPVGGTGGSVVAEVADHQFDHLAHQVHGRGQEIGAAESALSTACLSAEPPIESSGRGSKALLAGHVGLEAAGAGCRQ